MMRDARLPASYLMFPRIILFISQAGLISRRPRDGIDIFLTMIDKIDISLCRFRHLFRLDTLRALFLPH